MARDPYGYEERSTSPPMAFGERWGMTIAWLSVDVAVGCCTGAFTAFAWGENPEDPLYIVLFSAPFVGAAGAGTLVASMLGVARRGLGVQLAASLVLALIASCACPTLWFAGLVVGEMVKGP